MPVVYHLSDKLRILPTRRSGNEEISGDTLPAAASAELHQQHPADRRLDTPRLLRAREQAGEKSGRFFEVRRRASFVTFRLGLPRRSSNRRNFRVVARQRSTDPHWAQSPAMRFLVCRLESLI